jgi:hypothetical protein
MTPKIGMTPNPNYRPTSEYSQANTPRYEGGFSPGPNNISSPGYYPGSPGSPNAYGTSPAYGGAQSPIYRPF